MKISNLLSLTALLLSFSLIGSVKAQCGLQNDTGLITGEVMEYYSAGRPVVVIRTFNVSLLHVPSPFLEAKIYLEIGNNQLVEIITTDVFPSFVDGAKQNRLSFLIHFRCQDGSSHSNDLQLDIYQLNQRAPKFNQENYTVEIELPWPENSPLPFKRGIFVTDEDFAIEHATISVTIEPWGFNAGRIETIYLERFGDEHDYQVNFYVNPNITVGTYLFTLMAHDNQFATRVPVTILAK